MAHQVDDRAIAEVVAGWPTDARSRYAEIRTVLSLTPWNSQPARRTNPGGAFRFLAFSTATGFGFVYFVIIDHAGEVSLVEAVWNG